jgi:hypothetical protein
VLDRLRPAVEATLPALQVESELGRDHDLVTDGREGFPHELFARERAVDLRGVEERDAAVDRRPDQRDHRLLVGGRAVAAAHRHAAEPESRDFEIAKFACLHSSTITLIASRSFIAR